jgi:hypothetical protein
MLAPSPPPVAEALSQSLSRHIAALLVAIQGDDGALPEAALALRDELERFAFDCLARIDTLGLDVAVVLADRALGLAEACEATFAALPVRPIRIPPPVMAAGGA